MHVAEKTKPVIVSNFYKEFMTGEESQTAVNWPLEKSNRVHWDPLLVDIKWWLTSMDDVPIVIRTGYFDENRISLNFRSVINTGYLQAQGLWHREFTGWSHSVFCLQLRVIQGEVPNPGMVANKNYYVRKMAKIQIKGLVEYIRNSTQMRQPISGKD